MLALLLAAALVGPPAPDPYAALEARMAEVKRVADGTFTDAAIIGVASGFDIWTTEHCFATNPDCSEMNWLGQDSGSSRIALKAAAYPVKVGTSYILRRKGHHNWARGVTIAIAAIDILAGVRNLRNSR